MLMDKFQKEDDINDIFISSLQKCLNKFSYSFDGEMSLEIKCDHCTLNGSDRVVITEISWQTSSGRKPPF